MDNNTELVLSDGQTLQYKRWLPFLLAPMTMGLVYVAYGLDQLWLVSRATNEIIAMPLLGLSILGFSISAIRLASEFHFFMAVLCSVFFCREWHFVGTSNGVYVALVVLGVWIVKRQAVWGRISDCFQLKTWFIATATTYLLSQLIARRVFRYLSLPHEHQLHIFLEETVETMAHLMMLITCLVAWKPTKPVQTLTSLVSLTNEQGKRSKIP